MTIKVNIVNRRYINISQMIGRVVRILSLTTPSDIEEFQINIIDFKSNLFLSEIVVKRQNFEQIIQKASRIGLQQEEWQPGWSEVGISSC